MMESEWQKAIKKGREVKNIKIEVQYRGDSQRPTQFKVKYEINNEKDIKSIKNI